ncbi:MAG: dihydrodipicolinate synthase family protein [Proteobacteria bacterium]|nr:dihydrodipicolinate synthase family protein [Pseudomonadota bacterium]
MIPSAPNAFHGIYPSTVLPMRPDYAPDWDAFAAHTAACVLQPGIAGVLCNGHAGENFVISAEEKRKAVAVTVEAVGASRIVVAGVNHESSLAAAEEARAARDAGADAVMVFAPNAFALAQDGEMAERHHRIVAEAVPGMPLFLFQASVNAGRMAYTHDVLDRLLRIPSVVGIKEGGWEVDAYDALRRMVKARAPHIAVMASGDEHMFACFVHGSDGSLVSLADIVPEQIVALDAAVRHGDLAGARAVHERIEPLAEAIYGAPPGGRATARIKHCLHALGRLPCAAVRPPVGPVSADEAEMLEQALRAAGL